MHIGLFYIVHIPAKPGLFTLEQLLTTGVHDSVADVHALATTDKKAAFIMIWNYYDYDVTAVEANVNLQVNSIRAKKIEIEESALMK